MVVVVKKNFKEIRANLSSAIKIPSIKIDKNEHGTIFIEDNLVIIGLATDGDIRRKLIKENCNLIATIPNAPDTNSINVSNAAAIVFYELFKTNFLKDMDIFVSEEEASFMPRENIVIICTGSQGEKRSALYRIAFNSHRHISLDQDDVVIFSSKDINTSYKNCNWHKHRN